jgi:hypothetical protein
MQMADQRAEVQKHMTEFQANASRLLGYAQHAHEQYARGDAAGAAMTIALTHYDIGYLEDGRKNLIQAIEMGHSVTPRDAIRQMFDEQAGHTPA